VTAQPVVVAAAPGPGVLLRLGAPGGYDALGQAVEVGPTGSGMARRDALLRALSEAGAVGVVAARVHPKLRRGCFVHGLYAIEVGDEPPLGPAQLDAAQGVLRVDAAGGALSFTTATPWQQRSAESGGLIEHFRRHRGFTPDIAQGGGA
jgi:hypothetical protein